MLKKHKQMINQDQILNYLSSNKQDISQKYNLTKLGIFGSYARNEQTLESDLDLLVEFEENTPDLADKKDFLRTEIGLVFNLQVDVCREKYIKPIFLQQILTDAIYV
jgi:predicted nucleotidyltransferase